MKIPFVTISFFFFLYSLYGQKKTLEYCHYDNWSYVHGEKISNSGKFIAYNLDSNKTFKILIIQALDNSWKIQIPNGYNSNFTEDSRFVVFNVSKDSIGILPLNNTLNYTVIYGENFKLLQSKMGPWITYKLNNVQNELVLLDLITRKEHRFQNIKNWYLTDSSDILLLVSKKGLSGNCEMALVKDNLSKPGADTIIETNRQIDNILFDKSCSQLAFITRDTLTHMNSIWLHKFDLKKTSVLLNKENELISDSLYIENLSRFSWDGSKLYFQLKEAPKRRHRIAETANIDIWNYKDRFLQSQQSINNEYGTADLIDAVINIEERKIVLFNQDRPWDIKYSQNANADYVLAYSRSNVWEIPWRYSERPIIYLVSVKDGSKKIVEKHFPRVGSYCELSPTGKYVLWYDTERKQYYSYNTKTSTISNISKKIRVPLYDVEDDQPRDPPPFGIAGWLKNDTFVYIYDQYDIWQIDPNGIQSPINITNGNGYRTKTIYRFIPNESEKSPFLKFKNGFLLAGFNTYNKENGFFYEKINKAGSPTKLTMGPYVYYFPQVSPSSFVSFIFSCPVKARDSAIFIVRRNNCKEAPNLFSTKDFKNFVQLTNVQPQKNYNWMNSELIRWKMKNGEIGEGILYKPENFVSNKKYPIIFYLYERESNKLNQFLNPELCTGPINIPWFVSNGYLVFVPDIHYKIGEPGQSALNTVLSAWNHLSIFKWIDSSRIGIQGHSFGGYEVNYIITHTKMFAAAASAAGPTDLVSMYGNLRPAEGSSNQYSFENGQMRLGKTLWQDPNLFITNSPIFFADRVVTPLLIMHNKNDGAVPWNQGLEYYNALRRLGKKVWLLQYDNEGHEIDTKKNELDYSIRLSQFFDHYLKNLPSTKWMKQGVPNKLKGLELGLK